MAGASVVVLVMLVIGPVLIFAGGAAWSALLGSTLDAWVRQAHPESRPLG
ncbi:MAG: hypothetical protein ACRDZ7_02425 [Acidimicrobiia bacterium]